MQYTFKATDTVDTTIQLAMGEVTVTADDVDEVTVDVSPTQPGRPADVRAAENTAVDFSDNRLGIRQKRETILRTWITRSWSVDVLVRVPRGSRLNVTSSYGNIRIHGGIGPSSLTTSYGDISVGETTDLNARTTYGEISVERISGTASLTGSSLLLGEVNGTAVAKSSHGNLSADLVLGTLNAASGTGNIEIRTLMGELEARAGYGRIRIADAVSGTAHLAATHADVEVGIRPGTLAWLDLDTRNGTVRNELDTAVPAPGNDGDGTADRLKVTARSTHGSIRAFRAAVR